MFQEPSDHADHADVGRQPLDSRPNPAAVAHQQVHLHARTRGLVQGPRHIHVLQGVELHLNQAVAVFLVEIDLPLDLLQDCGLQDLRGREDLPVVPARLVAGRQVVEELGQVAPDIRVAGEQAHIGIQAGGTRVVVSRTDVCVPPQPIVVLPHHQNRLAVRLQPHDPVRDVDAVPAEPVRPPDVGRLVEPSLELHDGRDLLAVPGRLDQVVDGLGVSRRPVHGHLDGAHLGVEAGFPQEALD